MRIIRTIIFLLVCVALIWLLVILFSKIFSTNKSSAPAVNTTQLTSYARNGTEVQLISDGPVIVNENQRGIRITVDSTESKIELLGGYGQSVLRQDSFPNTLASYDVFLRSLDGLGFTNVNKSSVQDERGQCPSQIRYVYKLVENGREVMRAWSTSCGSGNFGGSRADVRTLFRRQIPTATFNSYTQDTFGFTIF